MTHLRVEQNTITENVTSNVIHKLYETAKAIIDAEEANEVEESQVSLKGNLQVSKAYGDEIDWLEAKFPDLHITAGTRYIRFADPEVLRVLLANNIGDGTGVTEADASAVTYIDRLFYGNTTVTSFNELRYFTGGVQLLNGAFQNTSNLQSIDLSTVSFLSECCFRSSGITGVINLPNITSMQSLVFDNCKNITEINFGPLLTSMADGTCTGCSNLQKVTGLSNKTTVPEGMFNNCQKLSNIDIDFSKVTNIGNAAFQYCKLLSNLDLSNVVSIGSNAFLGCTSLTNVDLSSCTTIRQSAFQGCTALTTCIWPTSVTTIPVGCFNGCTNLESLGSKISPTQVNNGAFSGCNKLTQDDIDLSSIVTIENNAFKNSGISGVVNLTDCTYIGEGAFNDCAVTEIHGPNVTSINQWSIYDQSTLQVLDLPVCSRCPGCPNAASLTTLNVPSATSFGQRGDLSLTNCRNLTTLNIPFENFIGVMNYAFQNCVGLSGQTFDFGTDLQYIGIEAFMNTSINIVLRGTSVVPAQDRSFVLYSGLIYVPDELVETYKTSTGYSSVSSQIKGISELPST